MKLQKYTSTQTILVLIVASISLFIGCQTNTTSNKTKVSSDADAERLTNAKLVIYKSDTTEFDLQKAEDLLKAIPKNSTPYNEAQSLLKFLEQKKNGESKAQSNNTPIPGSNRPTRTNPTNDPCFRACGARMSADPDKMAPQCSHVSPASAYKRCIDGAVDSVVDLCLKECRFK